MTARKFAPPRRRAFGPGRRSAGYRPLDEILAAAKAVAPSNGVPDGFGMPRHPGAAASVWSTVPGGLGEQIASAHHKPLAGCLRRIGIGEDFVIIPLLSGLFRDLGAGMFSFVRRDRLEREMRSESFQGSAAASKSEVARGERVRLWALPSQISALGSLGG
jgi:hypothetical protein